jgi:hypothetical protein
LTEPSSERRSHPRYPTSLELQGTAQGGGVVARMVADNLSEGGLYCTSTVDFPEMTRLAVRLMLPIPQNGETVTEPVEIEAVVVRREVLEASHGGNGDPRFKLGLFFTGLEPRAKESLIRYLDR